MQSRYEGKIFMTRVAQHRHGGSFLRIAWDLGTSWFDSLAIGTNGRASFYSRELTPIVHWTGFLGKRFYVGWTESLQYLITLLIGGL
jgi:hypothetical protein